MPSRPRPPCRKCGTTAVIRKRTGLCRDCHSALRCALKADLDMPPDLPVFEAHWSGGLFGPKWRDYRIHFFGTNATEFPNPCPWPYYRIENLVYQIWWLGVTYRNLPAYAERRWHPDHGDAVRVVGLENLRRYADAEAVQRGLKLIRFVERRGRPPGGSFDSPDECRDAALTWIEDALRNDRKPRREDAERDLLFVHSEGKQLARELNPFRWSDLIREAKRRHPELLS